MAKDYKTFLAAEILSESKIVSYRILSRELKVHCNAAKRMLYDFHHTQNARKSASVHATYLLYGTVCAKPAPNEEGRKDREDAYMQSSPFMSSSIPQEESIHEASPVKLVTLAKEEDLEAAKARYDEVQSIHIYSLEPSTIQNIDILADCNRRLKIKHALEDPLEYNKHYGTILNPSVKRRTGRRPPQPPAIASNKPVEPPSKPASSIKPTPQPPTKASSPPTQPQPSTKASTLTSSKPSSKTPTLKKETSSIFASFSKAKSQTANTAKLTRNDTSTSTSTNSNSQATEPAKEDVPMKDASSESEHEEDFIPSTTAKPKTAQKPPPGPSKAEREATLKHMMNEESPSSSSEEAAPTPPPEASAIANPPTPTPEPPATISGGRRRGRRKITKKKTIRDEEGYLVTKEEPAWESFSESEPEAPAKKQLQMPASSSASHKGGKKAAGGKQGQGSIMSFFGKK